MADNVEKPSIDSQEVDPTPGQKESASQDPFANNRAGEANPFASGNDATTADKTEAKVDKVERLINADEWDASKTPPSRFQQRKGSVYATPSSRDGHVDKNTERDAAYHAKLAEKGWAVANKARRGSKSDEK